MQPKDDPHEGPDDGPERPTNRLGEDGGMYRYKEMQQRQQQQKSQVVLGLNQA